MIVCYPSHQIRDIWPNVKDFVQRALDEGSDYTLGDVYSMLLRAKAQLWTWQDPDIEAVMVTAIQQDQKSKFCLLLTMAGTHMAAWKPHLEDVERWAREHGCSELRIYGRRGWLKLGFTEDWTRMSKKL